jgi:hypothetical protein
VPGDRPVIVVEPSELTIVGDEASELLSYLICRESMASPPFDPSLNDTATEVSLIPDTVGVLGADGTVSRSMEWLSDAGPPIPEMLVDVSSVNVTVCDVVMLT